MNEDTFLSEKDKNFEKLLKERFVSKWNEIKIKDVILSDKEKEQFNKTIEESIKISRIKNLVNEPDLINLTMSQFIFFLKDKGKVNDDLISRYMGIDKKIINEIETRQRTGYSISESVIVKILTSFRIKVKVFIKMLKNDLLLGNSGQQISNSFARSDNSLSGNKKSIHIQQGIDALFLELEKDKVENEDNSLNMEYINNVKLILRKNGENDLLKE